MTASIDKPEFAKMFCNPEITIMTITSRFGISDGAVYRIAARMGLPSSKQIGRKSGPTPSYIGRIDEMRGHWVDGMSPFEIGDRYGISHTQVYRIAQSRGWPKRAKQRIEQKPVAAPVEPERQAKPMLPDAVGDTFYLRRLKAPVLTKIAKSGGSLAALSAIARDTGRSYAFALGCWHEYAALNRQQPELGVPA